MNSNPLKNLADKILESAEISINGSNPWDIQIINPAFYQQVLKNGSLALGEAYVDHWWDCESLDQFFERVIKADLESKFRSNKWLLVKLLMLKIANLQNRKRAFEVGRKHYDLGNDLFKSMLDSRMNYTCGYWRNAANLDQAQLNKLELTCRKLMLEPGLKVLDIGCGFGSFAKYAAENFGVSVVGITISKEQFTYAQKNCRGLPIEIRLQDYRELSGTFDRVVSLGMFEHIGHLNHHTYMEIVKACLKNDGLFLLHTIGNNLSYISSDKWIAKYIFPNGLIPSMKQIANATEGLFIMEDWHNFGADYDNTLMAWHDNFQRNWEILKTSYDERFYRMWRYYLLQCAGSFRARSMQLWQLVLSKQGVAGGYHSPRFSSMPVTKEGSVKKSELHLNPESV